MKFFAVIASCLCVSLIAALGQPVLAAENSLTITASVPGCGDTIIQLGEECDGSNLNSNTCQTRGFSTGTLSCDSSCFFNTSQCANESSGGGGGGGSYTGGVGSYFLPPLFLPPAKFLPKNADLNDDGVVNLVDMSILLYYYNKSTQLKPRYDFNSDGRVDLIDISILLYYWTGDRDPVRTT